MLSILTIKVVVHETKGFWKKFQQPIIMIPIIHANDPQKRQTLLFINNPESISPIATKAPKK